MDPSLGGYPYDYFILTFNFIRGCCSLTEGLWFIIIPLKRGNIMNIFSSSRVLIIIMLTGLLFTAVAPRLWADTKTIPELIKMATEDLIPEFRMVASKALVAAYMILDKPLQELEELAARAQSLRGFTELGVAIKEALAGKYTSVCREKKEPIRIKGLELGAMSDYELERLTLIGSTKEIREAAAATLVERTIQSVGIEFNSYYTFRLEHEEEFDAIKLQLTKFIVGSFSPELRAATIEPLAQMFFAEFLITLKPDFIREKVQCP